MKDKRLYNALKWALSTSTFKNCSIGFYSNESFGVWSGDSFKKMWGLNVQFNFENWGYHTGEYISKKLYFLIERKDNDTFAIKESESTMEINEKQAKFLYDWCTTLNEQYFKEKKEYENEMREEALETLYHSNACFEPGEELSYKPKGSDGGLVKGKFISHDGQVVVMECTQDDEYPDRVGKKISFHSSYLNRDGDEREEE